MSLSTRFLNLIENNENVQVIPFSIKKLQQWCVKNIPDVTSQLKELNWNYLATDTWLETAFIHLKLELYGKTIGLYLTDSYLTYMTAKDVLAKEKFNNFRYVFGLEHSVVLLVDPNIFLTSNDIDLLSLYLEGEDGCVALDFSHYDEDDNMVLDEQEMLEWQWLTWEDLN